MIIGKAVSGWMGNFSRRDTPQPSSKLPREDGFQSRPLGEERSRTDFEKMASAAQTSVAGSLVQKLSQSLQLDRWGGLCAGVMGGLALAALVGASPAAAHPVSPEVSPPAPPAQEQVQRSSDQVQVDIPLNQQVAGQLSYDCAHAQQSLNLNLGVIGIQSHSSDPQSQSTQCLQAGQVAANASEAWSIMSLARQTEDPKFISDVGLELGRAVTVNLYGEKVARQITDQRIARLFDQLEHKSPGPAPASSHLPDLQVSAQCSPASSGGGLQVGIPGGPALGIQASSNRPQEVSPTCAQILRTSVQSSRTSIVLSNLQQSGDLQQQRAAARALTLQRLQGSEMFENEHNFAYTRLAARQAAQQRFEELRQQQ